MLVISIIIDAFIKLCKMKTGLLKITLSASLAGILLLLFLANILNPKLTNIGEINDKLLNKKVKVEGTISNIKTYEDKNFQVISIKDSTGEIDITVNRVLNLTSNQNLTVIGTIKEYEQKLQIQADKIISPSP